VGTGSCADARLLAHHFLLHPLDYILDLCGIRSRIHAHPHALPRRMLPVSALYPQRIEV
jgi:hypothetical protein